MKNIIVIRGAGDLATGVICLLHRCGFAVAALETEKPTAIRRHVALSEAVYAGEARVEDVTARLAADLPAAHALLAEGIIPVLVDPELRLLPALAPAALVDATVAKRNLGLSAELAPVVIALGPGFEAGVDCHAVIETNRGHDLGRVLYEGSAQPNTGTPGIIGGYGRERVLHAPVSGRLHVLRDIGSAVEKGELVAEIDGTAVAASLTGLVRGMLREGFPVEKGMKMADIDPRLDQYQNCFTLSDKARCIAGGVLEALMQAGVRP